MSKLSDLLIEQIEQGQRALKQEYNDLINENKKFPSVVLVSSGSGLKGE